jgi:hypothetical protein
LVWSAALAAALCALTAFPGQTLAARLIGGRRQAAVVRAFSDSPARRHLLIVSIRSSTVSPSWAVVRWVAPGKVHLHGAFFHRVGGHERLGTPPPGVRADLDQHFRVAIIYRGAGSEKIVDRQEYTSVCAGAGGYVDRQQETVSPVSWKVRYIVDLDRLEAAVASQQGSVVVPAIAYQAAGSELSATETVSRTYVDRGCFNSPTSFRCTTVFHLSGADPDLSFDPGMGTEIGIPMVAGRRGQCSPDDYTIGPSLWDGGASTALVPSLGMLGMLGTRLPKDPYAPVRVSWPSNSAGVLNGFLTSPCQGITEGCSDQMSWQGIVQLQPVSPG